MQLSQSALILLLALSAEGATTHYDVKLTVDLEKQQIYGREEVRFEHGPGSMEWQKQAALQILKARSSSGDVTQTETAVHTRIHSGGVHRLKVEYRALASRGFRWLPDKRGLFTAFYCEAWMVCSNSPDQRATLKLEIVVKESNLNAVGPGRLRKIWQDREGRHFLFEQPDAAQTYLFSFCVAELVASSQDNLTVWASTPGHLLALRRTADATAFMRSKAGMNAIGAGYVQAFLPQPGLAQEAAGMALLSSGYLDELERTDNVVLMAHELAHQWWGVSVGIRSWSDFWLNEGFAEFLSLAYLEHVQGALAYAEGIDKLKAQMDQIRASGGDRPLHFEAWTDVRDALGRVPYVKGALFLHRLRGELGEDLFWRGIALYTIRYAGQLVDSRDFQRTVEEASGRDLSGFFKDVWGR